MCRSMTSEGVPCIYLKGVLHGLGQYTWGVALSLMASTCLAEPPDILFSVGTEDQSPSEFLLASGPGWQCYEKAVHEPVRFIVGKSTPQQA